MGEGGHCFVGTGFADLDLDAKEVGGQVTWNLPEDLAQAGFWRVVGCPTSQFDPSHKSV